MSILSKATILERLHESEIAKRLVISPILDSKEQLNESSIDLRLGTEFIIPRRNTAHIFDPMEFQQMEEIHLRSDKEYVELGEKFYLHPNKVVLAGTLEFIRIPLDLTGRVIARSSYERLGLSVSTLANPGYSGALTLTLLNAGNTPIVLYPGSRVVQISLHQIDEKWDRKGGYGGKYHFEVGPLFSRAHKDEELKRIKKIREDS